jgi:hypothetical protein
MKLRILSLAIFAASLGRSELTRIEIIERAAAPEQAYERIVAKAYFAIDPANIANRAIADIELAPRNPKGLVEFSADLHILRPRDPAAANGTALLEVSNRGNMALQQTFDLGDGFLQSHGFTLAWIGWEFDVPFGLRLYAPIATQNGQPITGLVQSEWTGDQRVTTISLGDRTQIGYSVADPADPANQLTVRDHPTAERIVIPRNQWTFSDARHVTMRAGFEPGRIYEVIYRAKDPVVAGLGLAAVRDLASFLKYGDPSWKVQRTLGFGISQSGRFLREFLIDGFNADEQQRRAFDGVWAHVAGAGRGSFNVRFAQPSRDGHPFLNVMYPVDLPPFNELDGFLARAEATKTVPKIFLTNGAYEYWGRAASLIHTTEDGQRDVPPGPSTRIYFFAGAQHTPGSIPPRKIDAQNLADTVDTRCALRALLLDMQAWLKDNVEPPASAYPEIAHDRLVSLGAFAFPHIEGLKLPKIKREAYRLDFTALPPKAGAPYVTLVPQVDLDGNDNSGVRLPELRVPLATYTGWNLRSPRIGAPDELFSFAGSYLPFARGKPEREYRRDPRLSLEERYPRKRDYLEKITIATQELVKMGFLLDQDIARIRDRAAAEWDYVLRSR